MFGSWREKTCIASTSIRAPARAEAIEDELELHISVRIRRVQEWRGRGGGARGMAQTGVHAVVARARPARAERAVHARKDPSFEDKRQYHVRWKETVMRARRACKRIGDCELLRREQ
jgi:hypothetical protein